MRDNNEKTLGDSRGQSPSAEIKRLFSYFYCNWLEILYLQRA